jgi:hypothetical protein
VDNILGYIILTAAMAVLQFRESCHLLFSKEESVKVDLAFSFLEFLWFFVSVAILVFGSLNLYESLIPIAYVSYNIFGWGLSYYFNKDEEVIDLQNVFIPDWYLWSSLLFLFCIFIGSLLSFVFSLPLRSEQTVSEYITSNFSAIFFAGVIVIMLKSLIGGFYRNAVDTFAEQVTAAIQSNSITNDFFGEVIKVEHDNEVTAEYDDGIYGYFVYGEKNSGLLVAHYLSEGADSELITDGFIETESGEIIDLESISLQA